MSLDVDGWRHWPRCGFGQHEVAVVAEEAVLTITLVGRFVHRPAGGVVLAASHQTGIDARTAVLALIARVTHAVVRGRLVDTNTAVLTGIRLALVGFLFAQFT